MTTTTVRASSDKLVRLALKLDAALTGLNGLGYLVLAGILDSVLGYSRSVQYPVGAFLSVYAIAVLWIATRPAVSPAAVGVVIAMNGAWFVLSLVVAATGVLGATTAGTVWLVLQGVVVGGFAVLQAVGRKRM